MAREQTPIPSDAAARDATVLWGVVLAVLWGLCFAQLRVEWTVNPQYGYGWGVPWLGLYLAWRAWERRPAPGPVPQALHRAWVGGLLVVGSGCTWAVARGLTEANPDWRVLLWASTSVCAGASLAVSVGMGGMKWARHFAFPILFLCTATPWPSFIEAPLIQGLMRGVAGIAVEVLNWSGLPAVQRGNLIQMDQNWVGVDEACSGVRSLQSTWMAALFFTGMFAIRGWRVWAYVGGGLAMAMGLNIARALILAWVSARHGAAMVETWHDRVGAILLGINFTLLWAAGWRWRMEGRRETAPESTDRSLRRTPGWRLAIAVCVLIGAIEAGVWGWYRAGAAALETTTAVRWPVSEPEFSSKPVSEGIRIALRTQEARAGVWKRADGSWWQAYHARWQPGRTSAVAARQHRPETCLTAAGLTLAARNGRIATAVEGGSRMWQWYVFESEGRSLHVFFGLWDWVNGAELDESRSVDVRSRLAAAWAGRRHGGQDMVEIAVAGLNPGLVEAEFRRFARDRVRMAPLWRETP